MHGAADEMPEVHVGALCLLCFYSLESECCDEPSDLREDGMVSMTAGSKTFWFAFQST